MILHLRRITLREIWHFYWKIMNHLMDVAFKPLWHGWVFFAQRVGPTSSIGNVTDPPNAEIFLPQFRRLSLVGRQYYIQCFPIVNDRDSKFWGKYLCTHSGNWRGFSDGLRSLIWCWFLVLAHVQELLYRSLLLWIVCCKLLYSRKQRHSFSQQPLWPSILWLK